MSVQIDREKLKASGFTVEKADDGFLINGELVRAHGDSLILAPARSAFHRRINSALGGVNLKRPEAN